MSPSERIAHLHQLHAQHKDDLLQTEPPVFPYLVQQYPDEYGLYPSVRRFYDSLPVATVGSRRLFTFQDEYNYSSFGAPWIGMAIAASKARRIRKLCTLFNEGKPINPAHLGYLQGGDWQIITTDPALANAFKTARAFFQDRSVHIKEGVYRLFVHGCPAETSFQAVKEIILRFQGAYLVTSLMTAFYISEQMQRQVDHNPEHGAKRYDAWV